MDSLVDYARKSSRDADFHAKFTEQLTKAGKKLTGSVDRVLNEMLLTPVQHGVAYAELLGYKVAQSGDVKNVNEFLEQARALFLGIPAQDCTPAIGKALTSISRQFTKQYLQMDKCLRAIGPLKILVDKIAVGSTGILTCVHTDLLLVTVKAHAYDLVADARFLSQPASTILSLVPPQWPVAVDDYLQYWYYLGLHHSALKQYSRALEAYHMLLTTPAHGAVSSIQVEGYKKMILVSLLANGEAPTLNHRLTAPVVIRTLETLCGPYIELSKAYRKSSSSSSIQSEMSNLTELYGQIFLQDKTVGLIKQIISSLTKKQISKLTQTYITFSLGDIAAQVNIAQNQPQQKLTPAQAAFQAERYVYEMICSRDIFAKLNSSASLVRFLDDPEEYDTTPFIDAMDSKLQDVAVLSTKLAAVERELQLTPAYLIRSGIAGGGRGGEGVDIAVAKALSLGGGGGDYEDDQMRLAMEASLRQQ